jgi:hypothetical protein
MLEPTDAAHWRWRARQARTAAELRKDPESKEMLLKVADGYEHLAQQADGREVNLE